MRCLLAAKNSVLNHYSVSGSLPKKTGVHFRELLVQWYLDNQRLLPWRKTADPYRIWISEVMLQQTQVATVIPYYNRFLEAFPTIGDLAAADLEKVLKMWEGLGYYARARNFHKAAHIVTHQMNGCIPDTFDSFTRLPGVGDYIGAAVLSIAFDQGLAVVDGNVKRVLARLFRIDTPVNHSSSHRHFKPFADDLLDKTRPGIFNQAMMELGALVCTPTTPDCINCPVSEFCCAQKNQETGQYPKRLKKKKIPLHNIAVGVVIKKEKILITRRKLDGLLGGLWEFPGGKRARGESAQAACIREILEETGLDVRITEHLTTIQHAYTHFKISMDVFLCDKVSGRIRLNGPIDFKWIRINQIDQYAFPRANLKFIPMLSQKITGKT